MTSVIDRRSQGSDKKLISRQRFMKRNKRAIKKAVRKAIDGQDIENFGEGGIDVTIPKKDLSQPTITHDRSSGDKTHVHPGNKEFKEGDRLRKPQGGGGGQGKEGSPDGDGEDDYTFSLSQDEFLELIFEDLELPNLTKVGDFDTSKTKLSRSGFTSSGTPSRRDLLRSVRKRKSRRIPSLGKYNKEIEELLHKQIDILLKYEENSDLKGSGLSSKSLTREWQPSKKRVESLQKEAAGLRKKYKSKISQEDKNTLKKIDDDIQKLEKKKKRIPNWDEERDIQYRHFEQRPNPISKAVMFCLMDVSGSVSQEMKDNSKLFFWLTNLFLNKKYDQVDIVFIRHTQVAEEVDEKAFFYDRKTGGTVASTAYEKMLEIMDSRYPENEWNIYGAQSSDGDNSYSDNAVAAELLEQILPRTQGFFYIDVDDRDGYRGELTELMMEVEQKHSDLVSVGKIEKRPDIVPVFRRFFQRRKNDYGRLPGLNAA